MTLKALASRSGYPHSDCFNSLEISAKSCSLCSVLWDATARSNLFQKRPALANAEDIVSLQTKETNEDEKLMRMILIFTQRPALADDNIDWGYLALDGFVESIAVVALHALESKRHTLYRARNVPNSLGSPASSIITSQKAEFDSGSDVAFSKVYRWLWECSENHVNCPTLPPATLEYFPLWKDVNNPEFPGESLASPDSVRLKYELVESLSSYSELGAAEPSFTAQEAPPKLPSRVIDVGPLDGSQEPHLYICETPTNGFWVALSHCWGTIPLLRTTTETLVDHTRGIPMSKLPPSFRDAVLIVRKLGVRYLWIDSLCIIQNDVADWRAESEQMSRIYGMSFLTIIAAGDSDSHGGCFVQRSVRVSPAQIHPPDSPGPFYVTDYITNFNDGSSLPRDHADREPVERRGWCFQEALLPKRTLSYGTKMMTWRCQSGSFPEQGHHRNQPQTLYYELDRSKHGYSRWETIVQEYTRRSLTYQKDRFVALAGIVAELSRIWNDTYLAGLWRGDLLRQLLWRADAQAEPTTGIEAPRTHSVDFYAPSWSCE
jgi:hypothetical protein